MLAPLSMTQPIERSNLGGSKVEVATVSWGVGRLWGREVGKTVSLATRAEEGWAEVLKIAAIPAAFMKNIYISTLSKFQVLR